MAIADHGEKDVSAVSDYDLGEFLAKLGKITKEFEKSVSRLNKTLREKDVEWMRGTK